MKIKLKQQKNLPSADLITRYQRLLLELHDILNRLSTNIEKILHAKIIAIPRAYLSPRFPVVNPEILELSLNKDFEIVDYDKTVDISKLAWVYSCLRMEFIGSVNDIKAVFNITIRYNGQVEINGYNNEFDFDEFDELMRRALNPEKLNRF